MITCYVKYIINTHKLKEFEVYAKLWVPIIPRFGGIHHGYFLPAEGASNIAIALFSFDSLAEYEKYRKRSINDETCKEAFNYAEHTNCIVSYERSFFKPILE